MKIDTSRSRLVIRTFAEGLLSALAHDLEIQPVTWSGEVDGERVVVRVPVGELRVVGVLKRGEVDRGVLSASDRATIEKQIATEVLPGAEIVARGDRSGDRASIEVVGPRGTARTSCRVEVTTEAGATRARGRADVSLKALGAPPVKGPMGAFRVKDAVHVDFDLVVF